MQRGIHCHSLHCMSPLQRLPNVFVALWGHIEQMSARISLKSVTPAECASRVPRVLKLSAKQPVHEEDAIGQGCGQNV